MLGKTDLISLYGDGDDEEDGEGQGEVAAALHQGEQLLIQLPAAHL